MPIKLPAVSILGGTLLLLTGCQTRLAPTTDAAELQPEAAQAAVAVEAFSTKEAAPRAEENGHALELEPVQENTRVTQAEQSIWPDLRGAMALSHHLEQKRVHSRK